MKKSHGARSRSRKIMRKKVREKGLPAPSRFLEEYKTGQKVVIKPEPSVHSGMPAIRFAGRCGTVVEKKGRSFVVELKDGNKTKKVIAAPIHLRRV